MTTKSKRKFFTTEQIKAASSVPIIDYVQAKGIGKLTNQGSNYVKLNYDGHDSLVIDLRRNYFIHNSNRHDDNAQGNLINFIRYMSGNTLSFRDAVAEALAFKGENITVEPFVAPEKKPFEYDFEQAKYNSRGKNYLVKERQIDAKLIDWLFKKGYIMQEAKYNNLVFNWTEDGIPPQSRADIVGATQQTTQPPREGQPSKWIKESSKSDMGFNIQLGDKVENIYVFEASIDMLSYWSIHQAKLKNCRLVSLEGLKEKTFYHFLDQSYQAHPEGFNVHICIDNDLPALRFVNHLMQPKEDSPIKYIESIPHYYAISQSEAYHLKETCIEQNADYNMIASVYMIERHIVEKGTDKERDHCYFKDGIEQGVVRLRELFEKGFAEGVTHLQHDFVMRERITEYYQAFQDGKIEEVDQVQKDWNDVYRYNNRHQSKTQTTQIEKGMTVDKFIKERTVRLTEDRTKDFAEITAIDEKVLQIFAQKGWIRETTEDRELVFVWSDNGKVKGAETIELETTQTKIVPGSNIDHSFSFTVGQTKSICVFDSPLEALAFLNLYPDTKNTTFICNGQKDLAVDRIKVGLVQGDIHQINLCTSKNPALLERLYKTFSMDKNFICLEGKETIVHSLVPLTQSWQQDLKGYKEYRRLANREKSIDAQLDQLKKQSPSKEVTQETQRVTSTLDKNY